MKYNLLKVLAFAAFVSPVFAAFHKDAKLSTHRGQLPITEVPMGEYVKSFSPRTQAMGKAQIISKYFDHNVSSEVIIDLGTRKIKAMPYQQMFDINKQEWVMARNLTPRNILMDEEGSPVDIVAVKLKRRTSFSAPREITVGSKEHTLFVDGVLCHNMDDIAEWAAKAAINEGVKRGVLAAASSPFLLAAGGTGLLMVHAGRQVNKPGPHEYIPESFSDVDHGLPPALRDAGIEVILPAAAPQPAPPAAAPKYKFDQARMTMFKQSVLKPGVRMVEPGSSIGKRAAIQVPDYAPQGQFPGTAYKPQSRRPDQTADEWYEQEMRNSGSRIEDPEWQKKELERKQDERMAEINADPLLKARATHPKTKEQIALIEAADKAERDRRVAMQVQEMQRSNPALSIPRSANADQPLPPRVMESVNKSLMRASALSDRMRALPPHIAVNVLSKAQFQAGENRRAQELRDHLEAMRKAESQQLFERARNNEGMVKQQDAQRNQQQNEEILKQRLLAMSKARK